MDKFEKENNPVIIVNKDFKKCALYMIFPIKEDDVVKKKILNYMSFDKSSTYDTDKKIRNININNYCISYHGNIFSVGDSSFLEMILFFPSQDSLGIDVFSDNLKFAYDIIYNPYLEDDAFPKKDIDDIKKIIKNKISNNFKDAIWYYEYKNDKVIDEDEFLKDHLADNPSLLNNITPEDIYNLYKEIISSSPIVFLFGNVDYDKAKKEIEEMFLKNKKEMVSFEKKYTHFVRDLSVKGEISEKTNYKSSGVYYNYKVLDMGKEDMIFLKIVKKLISSNNSRILFDALRKENDLVYRCGAYDYFNFGSLTLWAITGRDNIDNVKIIFDDVMKKISDIDFITDKFNLILEEAKLDDELVKENLFDTLMKEVDKYIEYKDKSFYEYIKDIKPMDIKNFIENKLVFVSAYVGVGEDNE